MLPDGTCQAGLKDGVYMTVSVTSQDFSVWNWNIYILAVVIKPFYNTKSGIPSLQL